MTLQPLDFSSEVEGVEEGLTQAEIQEKIAELSTKEIDLGSLVEFDFKPVEMTEGQISLSVERSILREAATNLRILATSAYPNARLSVTDNRLGLEIYTSSGYIEAHLPLTHSSVDEEEGSLSFILPVNTLVSITQNIMDAVISFVYEADSQTLRVVNGYDISLSNLPTSLDFVSYDTGLSEAKLLGDFDNHVASICSDFVKDFAPKQGIVGNLTIAEWSGGRMYGGDTSHIGIFVPRDKITDIDFKISQELTPALAKLGKMMSVNTKLFETKDHYVIRDEFIMFGWVKPTHTFPPIAVFESSLSQTSIIVPRISLIGALKRMRIPLPCATANIELSYDNEKLALIAVDDFGKTSKDFVKDCEVLDKQDGEWDTGSKYSVNLVALTQAISASTLSNVLIKLAANGSVLALVDESDDYTSKSYLTVQQG